MPFDFSKLLPESVEDNLDEWVKKRLADPKPINWKEWQEFRMNSWEQEALSKKLSDSAYIQYARGILSNCEARKTSRPCVTCDEAAIVLVIPELIERLEAKV